MVSPDSVSPDSVSPDSVSPDSVSPDPVSPDSASSGANGTTELQGRESGRRWLILLIGLIAMTAGCTFQYGLAYLIPALRHAGYSLELASILVACPTAGLLLSLIAWGAAADRWGERIVLATGLVLAGIVLLAASLVHGPAGLGLCLALAGAAGGSVFAASGRLNTRLVRPERARTRHGHSAELAAARGGAGGRHASSSRGWRHRAAVAVPWRLLRDRGNSGRGARTRS